MNDANHVYISKQLWKARLQRTFGQQNVTDVFTIHSVFKIICHNTKQRYNLGNVEKNGLQSWILTITLQNTDKLSVCNLRLQQWAGSLLFPAEVQPQTHSHCSDRKTQVTNILAKLNSFSACLWTDTWLHGWLSQSGHLRLESLHSTTIL